MSEKMTPADLVARLRAMGFWKAVPNQMDKWIPDAVPLEAAAASRVPEWRTIDSAPKDGTDILIYCDGWYVAHWNSVSELWYFPEDGCAIDPTHWQPLPAAPSPEVKK